MEERNPTPPPPNPPPFHIPKKRPFQAEGRRRFQGRWVSCEDIPHTEEGCIVCKRKAARFRLPSRRLTSVRRPFIPAQRPNPTPPRERQKSKEGHEDTRRHRPPHVGRQSTLGGAFPLSYMSKWQGPFPSVTADAREHYCSPPEARRYPKALLLPIQDAPRRRQRQQLRNQPRLVTSGAQTQAARLKTQAALPVLYGTPLEERLPQLRGRTVPIGPPPPLPAHHPVPTAPTSHPPPPTPVTRPTSSIARPPPHPPLRLAPSPRPTSRGTPRPTPPPPKLSYFSSPPKK